MKSSISYSLLLAAAACGVAVGQTTAYTTPVGYVTETLRPNQYNLIGLTLQNPTVSAGVVASATSNSVTVTGATFSSLLTAGQTYILELADGTIQEVAAWTDTVLSTPENISSKITAGTTEFKLRKAATVSSVFGAQNSAGLKASPDGDPTTADNLVISTDSGLLTVYFFDDGAGTTGWYDASGNPADSVVLPYSDGFFVQRVSGSDINLVVSGELKKAPTSTVISPGYNYLSGVSPAGTGLTLATSGLADYISRSADGDASTVDNVLLPTSGGSYTNCYFFDDGAGTTGWYDASGNPADTSNISSGFLIYNVGETKSLKISVPSSYATL
jgi:hypothetical protein